MNFKDSVIIVTGSATGLGATFAKLAASKGARVVVNYTRSEQEAQETVRSCQAAGGKALLCQADVSVDEDCRRMASEAIDKWGRIDGLVNNAANSVFANAADLESLSADDFHRIFSVNVVGPYQMVRAVAPHMKRQGQGAIVNVSSVSSLTGSGSSIAYAASKGALNTMTLSLARALGPEIRVNAVLPGMFPSRWWSGGLGEERARNVQQQYAEASPLKSLATQDSIAEAIAWLMEGASHVTGETLMVDGGTHLIGFRPT